MDVEEVAVIGGFPDAAGVSAPSHVAGDPDVVWGAVEGVCWVVAVALEPGGDAGEDESATFGGWFAGAFVVCSADVNGVLEDAVFDGQLG